MARTTQRSRSGKKLYAAHAASIYDIVHNGWALDGRLTWGSQKFEFELAQREPEQIYDFSLF